MDFRPGPATGPHRRIVLCADDFGMSASVNAGVLQLARLGRLSATSCLVDGPAFDEGAPALARSGLQLGMHLNLTEDYGQGAPCMPLGRLVRAAWLRRLPADGVRAQVERQLRRFTEHLGRPPDYIDGHQHVHQLPGIREVLLAAVRAMPGPHPWLRDTSRPRLAGLPWRLQAKALVIASLGARGLRRQAHAQGVGMNPGFLGVYDFQGGTAAYARWMRQWLGACRDGDVLMCHPARGADPADPLSAQRQAEFQVLSGDDMAALLQQSRVTIQGAVGATGASMALSYHALADDFAVAPQLQPEDMQPVADAGFRSVIINRPDGEGGPEQPSSGDIIAAAQAAGLQVRYQPVVSGAITGADVSEFGRLLDELPSPVLAFCRSGARCTNLYQNARPGRA